MNFRRYIPVLIAALTLSFFAGCNSEPESGANPPAPPPEPPVVIRDSLARMSATLDVGGRKVEVQKIYVQHRLIFAACPPGGRPYELLDNNVLLVGRLEVHVARLAPGVYRLDGDGIIVRIADGAPAALVAWNDDTAWVAPRPAKFIPASRE